MAPGWTVKGRKSTRTVPIPQATAALLGRYKIKGDGSPYLFLTLRRLAQIQHRLEDGYLPAKFDLVPNMLRDFHVIQNQVMRAMAKARKVKVAEIRWRLGSLHDLRKSWCTHAAKKLPMHVLREYAGHADIATTANYYTFTTDGDADALRQAMTA